MTNKSQLFKSAHAAARVAMAEQIEIKHLSAHKTYAQLFAMCLKGLDIKQLPVMVIVEEPKFMWLRGM